MIVKKSEHSSYCIWCYGLYTSLSWQAATSCSTSNFGMAGNSLDISPWSVAGMFCCLQTLSRRLLQCSAVFSRIGSRMPESHDMLRPDHLTVPGDMRAGARGLTPPPHRPVPRLAPCVRELACLSEMGSGWMWPLLHKVDVVSSQGDLHRGQRTASFCLRHSSAPEIHQLTIHPIPDSQGFQPLPLPIHFMSVSFQTQHFPHSSAVIISN